MKTFFKLVPLVLFLFFAACEKENLLNAKIEGTWELRLLKGKPNSSIYKFEGTSFEKTINLNSAGSGNFAIKQVSDTDRNSGVLYPYKITFTIDGSKLSTFLKLGENTMVMSSGQSGVDESQWIYDRVK